MEEGVSVAMVICRAVKGCVSSSWKVRACVNYNPAAVRDIDELVNDLNKNLTRMRELLPILEASESLYAKLKEVSECSDAHLREGYFNSIWSAKDTRDRLGVLRRDLESAFQMTLHILNLKVALLHIYEVHASDTAQTKEDLQKILGQVISEAKTTGLWLFWLKVSIEHHKLKTMVLATVASAFVWKTDSRMPEIFT